MHRSIHAHRLLHTHWLHVHTHWLLHSHRLLHTHGILHLHHSIWHLSHALKILKLFHTYLFKINILNITSSRLFWLSYVHLNAPWFVWIILWIVWVHLFCSLHLCLHLCLQLHIIVHIVELVKIELLILLAYNWLILILHAKLRYHGLLLLIKLMTFHQTLLWVNTFYNVALKLVLVLFIDVFNTIHSLRVHAFKWLFITVFAASTSHSANTNSKKTKASIAILWIIA